MVGVVFEGDIPSVLRERRTDSRVCYTVDTEALQTTVPSDTIDEGHDVALERRKETKKKKKGCFLPLLL